MKPDDEPPDDESIARLLRDAGERERPAAAMQAEVRAAVESEWRDLVAARRRRRRVTGWAVAAGVGAGRARRMAGRPAPRWTPHRSWPRWHSPRVRSSSARTSSRPGRRSRPVARDGWSGDYERSVTLAPRSRSSPESRYVSTGRRDSPSTAASRCRSGRRGLRRYGNCVRPACRCILAAHRFGHGSASGDAIPGACRG